MKTGNVIIYDGKVGVLAAIYDSPGLREYVGVYFNGDNFVVTENSNYILLDENLTKYIDRHVAKFGKLKVSSRNKK